MGQKPHFLLESKEHPSPLALRRDKESREQ